MRVILLKKVDKLGNAGEIKEVSDGFASNYLIPQGMAKPASEGVVKQVEKQVEVQKVKDDKLEVKYRDVANKIDGKEFEIEEKSKDGKLFGSVKEKDVVELIGNKEIDEKMIKFSQPIKETGEYEVEIAIFGDVKAKIKLIVK